MTKGELIKALEDYNDDISVWVLVGDDIVPTDDIYHEGRINSKHETEAILTITLK